jgi:hypothetical protein
MKHILIVLALFLSSCTDKKCESYQFISKFQHNKSDWNIVAEIDCNRKVMVAVLFAPSGYKSAILYRSSAGVPLLNVTVLGEKDAASHTFECTSAVMKWDGKQFYKVEDLSIGDIQAFYERHK